MQSLKERWRIVAGDPTWWLCLVAMGVCLALAYFGGR